MLSSEDETTFVDQYDDYSPEHALPPVAAPQRVPRKHVSFTGSSNSKHRPSSPSAPSVLLKEVEPHAVDARGRFVNTHTDTVLVPSKPQDPFDGQKRQASTGFLDKLRQVSKRTRGQDEKAAQKSKTPKRPHSKGRTKSEEDPDKTLVEYSKPRSRKRKHATPMESSTSSSPPSSQKSRSLEEQDAPNRMAKAWHDALEPHQENMLGVLYEISHVSLLVLLRFSPIS